MMLPAGFRLCSARSAAWRALASRALQYGWPSLRIRKFRNEEARFRRLRAARRLPFWR